MTPRSTTLETLLNGRLAELLRQHGLEVEAEQVLEDHEGHRHQIDVLVELEEQAVAIEAEFAPARTVEVDARKRLPVKPLLWRGLPITSAFTLVYPRELQQQPESLAREELGKHHDLEFAQLLPEDVTIQQQLLPGLVQPGPPIGTTEGSITTLAECLHSFWGYIRVPKWRKYLILLSFLDNSSARPVQIGGVDVNIVIQRSTAVRGRRRSSSQSPPRGPFCRTRTGPVEADGAVDAQNAPTAPWKTLCVFHELPQGLSHQVTHENSERPLNIVGKPG